MLLGIQPEKTECGKVLAGNLEVEKRRELLWRIRSSTKLLFLLLPSALDHAGSHHGD